MHWGSVVKHNKIETGIYKTFHRLSFSRSGGKKFDGLRFRTNGVGTWQDVTYQYPKTVGGAV